MASISVSTMAHIGLPHLDFSLEISKKNSTIQSKAPTTANSSRLSSCLTIVKLMHSKEMSLRCLGLLSPSTKDSSCRLSSPNSVCPSFQLSPSSTLKQEDWLSSKAAKMCSKVQK